MRDILMWVLTVEVLGLACLPLLRAFFDNRRDAALLSRPVGLALVAYLGWALSLPKGLGFGRGTLLLALVLLGVASFLVRRSARRAGRLSPSGAPRRHAPPSSSGCRRLFSSCSAQPSPRSSGPRSSWTWRSST